MKKYLTTTILLFCTLSHADYCGDWATKPEVGLEPLPVSMLAECRARTAKPEVKTTCTMIKHSDESFITYIGKQNGDNQLREMDIYPTFDSAYLSLVAFEKSGACDFIFNNKAENTCSIIDHGYAATRIYAVKIKNESFIRGAYGFIAMEFDQNQKAWTYAEELEKRGACTFRK